MAARQTYYQESTGESTTTSASDQDKVSLVFTPDASSDYFIFASANFGNSAQTTDTRVKLVNTTSSATFNSINCEPKDSTDYPSFFGAARESFGASPAQQTYKIQYSAESFNTAKIKDARILALKAGSNDKYAESLGDSTTTSSSAQDKVTLTFTPASQGNYTLIVCADLGCNTTGVSINTHIQVDGGSAVFGHNAYFDDNTNFLPIVVVYPGLDLTAASHDIKLRYSSNGTATATIRNAKIIALRESDFEVAQTVSQRTQQTQTSSTYGDVAGTSLTFTPAAVEHIVFAKSDYAYGSTSASGYNKLVEGGGDISEVTEEPTNTSERMTLAVVYRKTLTATSTTWKIQHKSENGTSTVITDEIGIAVFQTATASGDVNANLAGVAGTGSLGSVSATGTAAVNITGVNGTGSPGTVTATLNTPVSVTGVAGTGSLGSVSATGDANINITGVSATGDAGNPSVLIDIIAQITGAQSSGVAGDVTALTTGAALSAGGGWPLLWGTA